MTIKIQYLAILLLGLSVVSGCKKFLEIDPPKDKITPAQAFENDETATSAITGIYSRMATSSFASGDRGSISVLCGLSADELKSHNAALDGFYQAEIPTSSTEINSLWSQAYTYIYTANAVLEGLSVSTGVTEATKKQLTGEAMFIRAFCYFYLINTFGDVPLNLTTDYRINETAGKTGSQAIYGQIISDLSQAVTLLLPTYISTERIRPNKWAAKALLARVFLYTKQWELAEQNATEVINQASTYSLLTDLNQVFLKNSKEAIWQLMPTAQGGNSNTREGNLFILSATPLYVSLSPDFEAGFDPGDKRKTMWIASFTNTTGKYFYPFKYKIRTSADANEYSMVIRFAEMYLIRAEARAQRQDAPKSLEDINQIRSRAGLLTALKDFAPSECLDEIEKQRKLELFSEWGHRWFDLKRTVKATAVLSSLKGATWKDTDELYPLPDSETSRNKNNQQNPGY